MRLMVGTIIGIVLIIIAVNIFMVLRRMRNLPPKTGRKAMDEEEALMYRHEKIQLMLDMEYEDAAKRVELRSKTWELYEQVRNSAKLEDD